MTNDLQKQKKDYFFFRVSARTGWELGELCPKNESWDSFFKRLARIAREQQNKGAPL